MSCMEIISRLLAIIVAWCGIYIAYIIVKKVAGETNVMQKIKSLLNTREVKAGILAGILISLICRFL